MTSADSRHLSPDEIVERVFPSGDRPAAVPGHLATCADCQGRVARLRSAWLLDRGAAAGVVESLPESFWEAQVSSVMQNVTMAALATPGEPIEASTSTGVRPFPQRTERFFMARRPAVAIGSLAATLLLVAGLTLTRRQTPAPVVAKQTPTVSKVSTSVVSDSADDQLLRDIDHVLSEDLTVTSLIPEETL